MSATKPETAAALHARPGRAGIMRTFGSALLDRRSRAGVKACTTGLFHASHNAPAAASAFKITPTNVVPRTPIAGISQKPAAIAPAAAPAVLAEYSTPTSAAAALSVGSGFSRTAAANHRAAIGNVAPIAAAG